jgi:hypothetical protein
MMRFDPDIWIGNDGASEPWSELKPFIADYNFKNRAHKITIWAHCWADAHRHAHEHGMRVVGEITGHVRLY